MRTSSHMNSAMFYANYEDLEDHPNNWFRCQSICPNGIHILTEVHGKTMA